MRKLSPVRECLDKSSERGSCLYRKPIVYEEITADLDIDPMDTVFAIVHPSTSVEKEISCGLPIRSFTYFVFVASSRSIAA